MTLRELAALVGCCSDGAAVVADTWTWRVAALALLLLVGIFPASARAESVRAELVRLQKQHRVSLVTLEPAYTFLGAPRNGLAVTAVSFRTRSLADGQKVLPATVRVGSVSSMSPDGSEIALDAGAPGGSVTLAVIALDGHIIGKYPYAYGVSSLCWSPDKSKIVLSVMDQRERPCRQALRILDLTSGSMDEVDANPDSSVTSQCWSPDGKELVYTRERVNEKQLRIYDVGRKASSLVAADGFEATWSPDGKWISFLSGNIWRVGGSYRLIAPNSGSDTRSISYRGYIPGPLWWSPDGGFVAYVSQAGSFEQVLMGRFITALGDLIDNEGGHGPMRLRVKRIEDGRETSVLNIEAGEGLYNGHYRGTSGPTTFQWRIDGR